VSDYERDIRLKLDNSDNHRFLVMLMIYVWEFYSICIKSCTRNIEQDNAIEKHVRFVNSVMFLVVSLFW